MVKDALEIVRRGGTPPCLRVGGRLCRGCSGWRAMVRAVQPGGPWEGLLIHCPCTGLTARGAVSLVR